MNKDAYNKIADQWIESREKSFLSDLVLTFASKIKKGGKILDIGCGAGYPIATYLTQCGFDYTGIDISDKLLKKAIDRNLQNARFYLCDFFDFEPEAKFDGIIAFDSLFHFPKEKQASIYSRVASWMNKGAYFLFTHGCKDGEITGPMFNQDFYYSSLDREEVCDLLSESGLKLVWYKEKYVERDTDRDLVMLVKS